MKKILRFTGGSSKRIVHVMEALVRRSPPDSWYSVLYEPYYTDFSGKSFLVDPYSLVAYKHLWKPKEIAQYVALASYRNYAYYATTKDASLDLFHSPVAEDIINNNRLLKVENDRVLFKYEEVKRRK